MELSSNTSIQKITALSKKLKTLYGIGALLSWDQETFMPKKGVNIRAQEISYISGITHEELTQSTNKDILEEAQLSIKTKPKDFTLADRALIREFKREYDKATKLPNDFVMDFSELTSKALEVWKSARETDDFKKFQPHLERIVEMLRKKADLIGYKDSPYDALIDDYEPDTSEMEIQSLLQPLKDFTLSLLPKLKKSKIKIDQSILFREYPKDLQFAFSNEIAKDIGYDFGAGTQNISAHPFTQDIGSKNDVRITTRITDTLAGAIMGTIHESGHAMYEQGVADNLDMTALGGGISLGIHESQSRMWENFVGRSEGFWKYFFPKLVSKFPLLIQPEEAKDFVLALNCVKSDFIRVEADELTYNLHIIIRFELEKELIRGNLLIKDLPEAWNAKMQQYLGVTPPTNAKGVLQDIHWAMGSFGYFPTYSLGNLYAAQFWNTINKDIPNLQNDFTEGNFSTLLAWLRKNIHQYGKIYTAKELVKNITGEELTSKYLIEYLQTKFETLYKI